MNNFRQLPAVKKKINGDIWAGVLMPLAGIIFLFLAINIRKGFPLFIFGAFIFIIGLYSIYDLLKFRKLLQNIERGNCIILQGKGVIAIKGLGKNKSYVLNVETVNPDGTRKVYTSDSFRGKLARKVGIIKMPDLFKPLAVPLFGTGVNKVIFDKVLAEDFTVYVDTKNPENYFVDISPLYIVAEQK